MHEQPDFCLTNAMLVLPDHVTRGYICVSAGKIAEIGEGQGPAGGMDVRGDFLVPGLVELHTDHLEPHFVPRAKVRWNALAAVLSYDGQIATSGITTVFDSLRVGAASDRDAIAGDVDLLASALDEARDKGLLRAEHLTHLRCEIATPDVIAATTNFLDRRPVRLISLMDHTPGQRQFRNLVKMREYYIGHGFVDDVDFAAFLDERHALHARFAVSNRRALVALAQARQTVLASHDDATLDHVREAIGDGVAIAEFPTTLEAATASHAAGISVLMGAPNIVRGGSHSGNVAAQELAQAGLLDILSSDYVPASLLLAAFELPARVPRIDLAKAIAMVSKNPAQASGLHDRGALVVGLRADLAWVAAREHVPVVRALWREGRRVA